MIEMSMRTNTPEIVTGDVSRKRSDGPNERAAERANLGKQPSRSSSLWHATPETSRGGNGVESKADSWEKDQMKKVQSR